MSHYQRLLGTKRYAELFLQPSAQEQWVHTTTGFGEERVAARQHSDGTVMVQARSLARGSSADRADHHYVYDNLFSFGLPDRAAYPWEGRELAIGRASGEYYPTGLGWDSTGEYGFFRTDRGRYYILLLDFLALDPYEFLIQRLQLFNPRDMLLPIDVSNPHSRVFGEADWVD